MHRNASLLLLALAAGLLAWVVKDAPPDERLADASLRLERQIHAAQDQLHADLDGVRRATVEGTGCTTEEAWPTIDPALRAQWETQGTAFRVLCDNALVAWSGSVPLEQGPVGSADFIRRQNGCWLYARAGVNEHVQVDAIREVWYVPPFENRYLRGRFNPAYDVEEGIEASLAAGLGPVVREAGGAVLFRLRWKEDVPPPGAGAHWRAILVLLCVILVAAVVWRLLSGIATNGRPWQALIGMLVLCGLSCFLLLGNGPLSLLSGFRWADPDLFASAHLPSFAHLLLATALVTLAAAFSHRMLRSVAPPLWPVPAAALVLALLLGSAALINEVMIALVRDSRIPLDLFHAQELNLDSMAALLAIACLLFAWTLLADGPTRWILPGIGRRTALIIVLGAFVAAHLAYHYTGMYDSVPVLWPLPVLLALGVRRLGRWRWTALLVSIASLSFFTVHEINRQNFKRADSDRAALAESAVAREDPVVEWLFREARTAIAHDPSAMELLSDTGSIAPTMLDTRLRLPFFQGAWDAYDVRLHLFGTNGRARGSTSRGAVPVLNELRERFGQGVPVEGDTLLRNTRRPMERALYIGQAGVGTGGTLVVELLPRALPEGIGFPELLMAGDRAMDRRTGRFARARYERGSLVESSGAFAFPVRWEKPVPVDGLELETGHHRLYVSGDPGNTVVVIATRMPGWRDHLTTFSYILILYALLAAGYLFIRNIFAGRWPHVLGVANKLRAGILLLACIAVVLFAVGSQRLLDDDISARTKEQLDERSRSALAELRRRTHAEPRITPAMFPDIDRWIDRAATVLLTDITAWTPEGGLMATSREQVFVNGLLGRQMDPDAYEALALGHRSVYTHTERIGEAEFLATYRPLLNDDGEVLAYLEVPYYARQSEVDDARAAGYVTIVNLFVLLLLIGTAAATLIAAWTTRPLSVLKRGLERIQLGARNEPLPYQGDDELGELVRVYNRKVEELRISAEKLARSERESAWKEMARQVAHEIKNPLTPMKLNIQHFQHTWRPDSPDAKERLDRFSDHLVDQIDVLSRIANEFSHFAQMPPAHPTALDLGEVADTVVQLFAHSPGCTVRSRPCGPLPVHADREHLLRVFTNLIKNALQAIPEDRDGRVDVILGMEGAEARAEVRDNGSGIPADAMDQVFVPKFTTKTSGMGLGLPMVKRMVENAGGRVWFTSVEGEGSSFFVALPLRT